MRRPVFRSVRFSWSISMSLGVVFLVLPLGIGCAPSTGNGKKAFNRIATATQSFDKAAKLDAQDKELTNSIGMKLARIEPGEVTMGWDENFKKLNGPDYDLAGGPLQKVKITRPFYMGVYEVTQEEYEKVMGVNPSNFRKNSERKISVDLSNLDTSKFPVESVTWHNAMEFCKKLSELPEEVKAGRVYTLPTEAQWDYASRAGKNTYTHFGNEITPEMANFNWAQSFPSSANPEDPPIPLNRTTTVGSFPKSDFGLFDMHGNVQEWCADSWRDLDGSVEVSDPIAASGDDKWKCLRGGCYNLFGVYATSAYRNKYLPTSKQSSIGFRVIIQL